jgi:DNA repair protein RecO (recombination protein O)
LAQNNNQSEPKSRIISKKQYFSEANCIFVLVNTQGLVIKTIKYQESSLIVKVYTRTHGMLSFLVNGVRSTKAHNKAALFQPLTFLDLVIYYRDNKNLLRIKEFRHSFIYQTLPFDVVKSSVAQLMLEVAGQCLAEEETDEELFDFFFDTFTGIDAQSSLSPNIILDFLIDFMGYIGINPHGIASASTPYFNLREGAFTRHETHHEYSVNEADSKLLNSLLLKENPALSRAQRKYFLQLLINYYRIHVEGFRELRSLKILEAVLG